MEIYRVENSDGLGPFQGEPYQVLSSDAILLSKWTIWRWSYIDGRHPAACEDYSRTTVILDKLFACPNEEMLMHWFGPILDVLDGYGLVVMKYFAEEVVWGKSRTQVVFDLKDAAPLGTLTKNELLRLKDRYESSLESFY